MGGVGGECVLAYLVCVLVKLCFGCLCCLGDKKEGAALGEDTIDENYGVAVVFHEEEGEGQEERGGDTYVREEPVEEEGEGVEAEFEGVLHAEVSGRCWWVVCVLACEGLFPRPPAGHGHWVWTGAGHAEPSGGGRILASEGVEQVPPGCHGEGRCADDTVVQVRTVSSLSLPSPSSNR